MYCLFIALAMSWATGSEAVAQSTEGSESSDIDDEGGGTAPGLPSASEPEVTLDDLRRDLDEQRALLEEMEARLQQQEDEKEEPSMIRFFGYADIGFFAPLGNEGVGWVRDVGNTQFPEFAGQYGWVFLGDIFATTVNSRGEVADLGDAPAAPRFDSINSGGALGFLINEVNIGVELQLASSVLARTSFNVVPRTGSEFALGDFLDLDLAEVEWVLTDDGNTSVWVGKTLPVFGIEYKERKSNQRFGITPSLIHRYTSGTQLGLKGRTKLFDGWLVLAGSLTNGSATTEQFHFYNEIDTNNSKTLNGRAAVAAPIGTLVGGMLAGHKLEVGVSGTWGAQDRASDSSGAMWFVGVDLQYRTTDFALKGQWMKGRAPGLSDERVWGLDLKNSGYVEVNWMFLPYLGVLARGGFRDAFVFLGTERAYITKSIRMTGGIRAVFNPHMVAKLEYLHNREYGGIAQFDNDVFTSSFVVSY